MARSGELVITLVSVLAGMQSSTGPAAMTRSRRHSALRLDQFQHPFRRSPDHRPVAMDKDRPLDQLRVRDHRSDGARVIQGRVAQTERGVIVITTGNGRLNGANRTRGSHGRARNGGAARRINDGDVVVVCDVTG